MLKLHFLYNFFYDKLRVKCMILTLVLLLVLFYEFSCKLCMYVSAANAASLSTLSTVHTLFDCG
jgi:hypothetical protein